MSGGRLNVDNEAALANQLMPSTPRNHDHDHDDDNDEDDDDDDGEVHDHDDHYEPTDEHICIPHICNFFLYRQNFQLNFSPHQMAIFSEQIFHILYQYA